MKGRPPLHTPPSDKPDDPPSVDRQGGNLIAESAIYAVGIVLSRGLGLLLTPILTRALPADEFGRMDLYQIGAILVSLALSLQMESALLRYYTSRDVDARVLFSTAVLLQLGFGIGLTVMVVCSNAWIGRLYPPVLTPPNLLAAAVSVPAGTLYTLGLTLVRARREPLPASLIIGLNTGLNVAGVVGFVLYLRLGITGVFLAKIAADAISFLVIWRRHRDHFLPVVSTALCGRLIRFGLPLVPDGFLTLLKLHASKVFLATLVSMEDVGLLAVAGRIATAVQIAVLAFRQAWLPYALSIAERPGAAERYSVAASLYLRLSFALVLLLALLAPELIRVLAGGKYAAAVSLVAPLGAAAAIGGLPYLYNIGLLLAEKTIYYTYSAVWSAVTVILAAWFLISRWGLPGAPVANILGSLSLTLAVLHYAQRVHPLPYGMKSLIGFMIGVCGIAALGMSGVAASLPLGIRIPAAVATIVYSAGLAITAYKGTKSS